MVAMGVRDEDVFNLAGIQAELPHPVEYFVLRLIVEESLEQNDALAPDKRPGVVDLRAEKVEIVGGPGGLRMPRLPGRRPPSRSASSARAPSASACTTTTPASPSRR